MKLRMKLISVVSILALLLSCAVCQAGIAEVVTENRAVLRVSTLAEDGDRVALLERMEASYQEAFPNFEVDWDTNTQDYAQKLRVECASNDVPDVFWCGEPIPVETGNALDLTDLLEADGWTDKVKTAAALIPYKDGRIYTVQAGNDAYYLHTAWYNKDIFEAAGVEAEPTTYAEFLDMIQKLIDYGVTPIGIAQSRFAEMLLPNLMVTIDPDMPNKLLTGEIKWTEPEVIEALEKLKVLADMGAFNEDAAVAAWDVPLTLLNEGKAAMWYEPTWGYGSVTLDNFDFLLIPTDDGSKATVGWGSFAGGYSVSAHTKYPEEALMFAEWMAMQDAIYFEQEQNMTVGLETGLEPSEPDEIMKKNNAIVDDPEYVLAPSPAALWPTEVYTELQTQIALLVTNQADAETVAANMAAISE